MNYTYSEHPQIWDCRHQVQVPKHGVVLGRVLQPISHGHNHRLKKGVPWLGSKHNANLSWSQRQHSRRLPSPPSKPPAEHTAVTKTSDHCILCLPRVLLPCVVTLLPKLLQRGPLRLSRLCSHQRPCKRRGRDQNLRSQDLWVCRGHGKAGGGRGQANVREGGVSEDVTLRHTDTDNGKSWPVPGFS